MDKQEFIDDCLREHNRCRHLHAVNALRHSINLDKSAQEWAEDLITKDNLLNSPISSRGEVGENISSRSSSSPNVTLSGTEVAKQWYGDIKNYDFSKSSGAAGNFTQLIWKSTEEVGFGIAHLKGKCVVVAHYRPPGNVRSNYTTNVMPPVSGDVAPVAAVSDTDSCNKHSNEFEGNNLPEEVWTDELCLYKTASSHERTDSMSSDEQFEMSLHEFSYFHNAQKRQLREFIREFVSTVNKYRILHDVPGLYHNKELDDISQKWAEELSMKSTLSNSNNKFKGDRVGESIASRWSTGKCDYKAKEVVDHWYSENKKFNFGQEPQNVQGIGNFTQMIWLSSKEIGIGKAQLTKNKDCRVIVVCSYYPAGNILKHFSRNVLPASRL